jgi:hypothetical protein
METTGVKLRPLMGAFNSIKDIIIRGALNILTPAYALILKHLCFDLKGNLGWTRMPVSNIKRFEQWAVYFGIDHSIHSTNHSRRFIRTFILDHQEQMSCHRSCQSSNEEVIGREAVAITTG